SIMAAVFLPFREDREVVLVDLRGTDATDGLRCPQSVDDSDLKSYFQSAFEPSRIRRCRTELERTHDLTQYGSIAAIEDLEEVRVGLGYSKINLLGISGGTRMAMVYLRHRPDAIRSVALTG